MIGCVLDRAEVPLGGALCGTVHVAMTGEKRPRTVAIAIAWRTDGRGEPEGGSPARREHEVPEVGGDFSERFELPVPISGPVSFEGRLLRILWEVRVELDVPWAKDVASTFPFRVTSG